MHIDHALDDGLAQGGDELLDRPRAIADGVANSNAITAFQAMNSFWSYAVE